MHDSYIPHCSFCEHFISSFYTDLTTEWGYCKLAQGKNAPTRAETDAIKQQIKSGNWSKLNEMQGKKVLFVPTEIDCPDFIDVYPE